MRLLLLVLSFLLGVANSVAQDSTVYYQGDCFPKAEIPMYVDSIQYINKIISAYPDSAYLYYRRGCHLLAAHKPSAAKKDLKKDRKSTRLNTSH